MDHRKRVVQFDRANEANGSAKGKNVEIDDREYCGYECCGGLAVLMSLSLSLCVIDLDMEYRYWAFIEGHPAHTTLPVNARVEAMDVLTWAWTGESVVSIMMDSNA